MRPGSRRLLSFVLCLGALTASPGLAQETLAWVCWMPGTGEQRRIELVYQTLDVVPCQAFDYGTTPPKLVASYGTSRGRCESHVASLLRNLQAGGYSCGHSREAFMAQPAPPAEPAQAASPAQPAEPAQAAEPVQAASTPVRPIERPQELAAPPALDPAAEPPEAEPTRAQTPAPEEPPAVAEPAPAEPDAPAPPAEPVEPERTEPQGPKPQRQVATATPPSADELRRPEAAQPARIETDRPARPSDVQASSAEPEQPGAEGSAKPARFLRPEQAQPQVATGALTRRPQEVVRAEPEAEAAEPAAVDQPKVARRPELDMVRLAPPPEPATEPAPPAWPELDAVHAPPTTLDASTAYFAIASTHATAEAAQDAVAELRRKEPFVRARAFPPGPGQEDWSVMLAAYASEAEAQEAVALAEAFDLADDAGILRLPDPLPQERPTWTAAPDAWQRILFENCHRGGARDTRALAGCSGLAGSAEEFATCLAGGECRAREIAPGDVPQVAIAALPADIASLADLQPLVEPVLAAEQAAAGCRAEAATAADRDAAFGDCMSRALAHADTPAADACRARHGPDGTELALCLAGDRLPAAEAAAARCLLGAPSAEARSRCVADGLLDGVAGGLLVCAMENDSRATKLFCMADVGIPRDYQELSRCLLDAGPSADEMLGCAADGFLDPEQQRLVRCGSLPEGALGFAQCLAENGVGPPPQRRIAEECAGESGGQARSFSACAGDRLAAREIGRCLAGGPGCFGPDRTIAADLRAIGDELRGRPEENGALVRLVDAAADLLEAESDAARGTASRR